jgi:hypothetical protein
VTCVISVDAAAEEPPGAVPVGNDLRPEPIMMDQLLTILGAAGRPVRCKDVVAALGEDPAVARRVERVRNRLKKLAVAGRVVETEPGLFTLTDDSGPSPG